MTPVTCHDQDAAPTSQIPLDGINLRCTNKFKKTQKGVGQIIQERKDAIIKIQGKKTSKQPTPCG
jgi:hypothetical protein